MFNFIKKRRYWYLISGLIIVPGLIAILSGGLNLGIDFTGGSIIRLTFESNRPSPQEIESILSQKDLGGLVVQPVEDHDLTIRLKTIDQSTYQDIFQTIKANFVDAQEVNFESIGPTIGQELKSKAITSIILVLLFIIIYITYAFRKISGGFVKSWVFGVSAIIALLHDLLFVVGIFAILGKFLDVEIDILFITAMLTILGFSVHDTIVVFDRIREHLKNTGVKTFETIINESINETLIRSINTSLTTLLVLSALYLFGGDTIKMFTLTLLIGITIGTYSSIFIASPLLFEWYNFKNKNT